MKDNYNSSSSQNIRIITRLRGSDKTSKFSKLLKLSDNLNINLNDIIDNLSKTSELNQQKEKRRRKKANSIKEINIR